MSAYFKISESLLLKEVIFMPNHLKRVTCDPDCGFMVQDHDETELKKFVKDHLSNTHHKQVSDTDVEKSMKDVGK